MPLVGLTGITGVVIVTGVTGLTGLTGIVPGPVQPTRVRYVVRDKFGGYSYTKVFKELGEMDPPGTAAAAEMARIRNFPPPLLERAYQIDKTGQPADLWIRDR